MQPFTAPPADLRAHADAVGPDALGLVDLADRAGAGPGGLFGGGPAAVRGPARRPAPSWPRYLRPAGAADVGEFERLVRGGLVRRLVADLHAVVDVADDVALRAGAVVEVLPDRLVEGGAAVCGADAAWVWAGGDPLDVVHVVMPVGRARSRTPLVVVHEGRLPDDDVEVVHGLPVTVPARTAADVARSRPSAAALELLGRLADHVPLDPRDVLVRLERLSGCRGVEAGRRTVLEWMRRPGPGDGSGEASVSPAAWPRR